MLVHYQHQRNHNASASGRGLKYSHRDWSTRQRWGGGLLPKVSYFEARARSKACPHREEWIDFAGAPLKGNNIIRSWKSEHERMADPSHTSSLHGGNVSFQHTKLLIISPYEKPSQNQHISPAPQNFPTVRVLSVFSSPEL
jgi:hypothetical protein